jgi:predicted glycosyltransferase
MTDSPDNSKPAIWIDLDNSPHVPLFAPIIKHFREEGIDVILTARDHSQTIQLLDLNGFRGTYTVVGRHYGGGVVNKLLGTFFRAKQLRKHVRRINRKISVAVSHGSRAMVLATRWLKIPILTMYDYEFTETRIFNRFSTRVLVPDSIPDDVLDRLNLPAHRRVKYPGIKEEIYLNRFHLNEKDAEELRQKLGFMPAEERVIAIFRPPATTANYHEEKGTELSRAVLRHLLTAENVYTVIVPRTHDQATELNQEIADLGVPARRFKILAEAVDGIKLVAIADLLISGGGTMNREAALLGTPVYSIFAGRQGALDAQMERDGRIVFIREPIEIEKLKLKKRSSDPFPLQGSGLTDRVERFVIEQISSFLDQDR